MERSQGLRERLLSMRDPDSHARLEACRFDLWVEPQAQRIAVVIANDPLGLPCGKRPEWPQFSDYALELAIGSIASNVDGFAD